MPEMRRELTRFRQVSHLNKLVPSQASCEHKQAHIRSTATAVNGTRRTLERGSVWKVGMECHELKGISYLR